MKENDAIASYFGSLIINTEAFHLTDEELEQFCKDNPQLRIERNEKKEIIIMSPSFAKTGAFQHLLGVIVGEWNRKTKAGIVVDSSTGFFLPDGAMFSPDLAWIPIGVWRNFSEDEKNSFLRYCPDFVVEVKSKTDRLQMLQKKMQQWISNGSKLAWLIDPDKECVWIYRKDGSVDEIKNFNTTLHGEEVLIGFSVNLQDIRIE